MRSMKPHLERLAAYPYRKVEAPIKLDQNESPYHLPPELRGAAGASAERPAAHPLDA